MVKLKTEDSFKYGQKNVLPFVGETQISDEGIIEVADKATAEALVECEIGFHIIEDDGVEQAATVVSAKVEEVAPSTTTTEEAEEEVAAEQVEEEKGPETPVEEVATESVEEKGPDMEDLIKQIDTLTVPALQSMAAPFPKEEWGTLTKEPLKKYLKEKLTT